MCPERQTMPQQRAARRPKGFTLLEVIVIIIVMGLLGALVMNLMGTQLMHASNPATAASDAAEAEAAMEAVVAYYTASSNNSTSGVLADVASHYAGNSTVSLQNISINGVVPALQVTTTTGNTAYTTLLTQERTNASDNATNF